MQIDHSQDFHIPPFWLSYWPNGLESSFPGYQRNFPVLVDENFEPLIFCFLLSYMGLYLNDSHNEFGLVPMLFDSFGRAQTMESFG